MGCNCDSGCRNISKKYIDNSGTIKGLGNDIIGCISDVSGSVSSLDVPDDYIGSKVRQSIEGIVSALRSDIGSVNGVIGGICGFANDKSEEHLKHYEEWKRREEEEERKRRKSETLMIQ